MGRVARLQGDIWELSKQTQHNSSPCWVFLVPWGCQAQACWEQVSCQGKHACFTIPPPQNNASPPFWDGKQLSRTLPAQRGHFPTMVPRRGAADGEQKGFLPWS